MSGIYRRLLDRIAADPAPVCDQRLSLSGRREGPRRRPRARPGGRPVSARTRRGRRRRPGRHHRRAAACADAGDDVDAARGAAAARRADRTRSGRGEPRRRQRPARLPALLHAYLRPARPARRDATRSTLQPRLDIPVARARRARAGRGCAATRLPAPLHLAGVAAALPAAARRPSGCASPAPRSRCAGVDRDRPGRRRRRASATGCAAHGQTPRDHRRAVGPRRRSPRSTRRPTDASLALAATVFQIGLLTDAGAADIGWSRVPLQRAARRRRPPRALAAAGRGRADQAPRSTRCEPRRTRLAGHGARRRAPIDGRPGGAGRAARRRPSGCCPPGSVAAAAGLVGAARQRRRSSTCTSSSTGRCSTEPFVAGVGTPGAVGLRPHRGSRADRHGQYLAVSLSAADDVIDLPAARAAAAVPAGAGRAAARRRATRRVLDFFVTRERQATFRPGPGTARAPAGRPRPRRPGSSLAGAWTDTGWPATMEGAVRSGERGRGGAARAPTRRTAVRRHDRPARRRRLTASRPGTAVRDARRCPRCRPRSARLDPASRAAGVATTSAGPTPTGSRATGGGGKARPPGARAAVGARPPARPPRSACPARSPSSWCTTSRCCTTT